MRMLEERVEANVDRVEAEANAKVDRIERTIDRGFDRLDKAISDLATRMWDGQHERRGKSTV
jgi:hypothetical protein